MLFNEWTSDLSEQEIYLMKQVLNRINDKIGQIDTDVDRLKKPAQLIESGELTEASDTISIDHDLYDCDCALIHIEVASGTAGNVGGNFRFSNGDTEVGSGSINTLLANPGRIVDIHIDRITDDYYHVDTGAASNNAALVQTATTGHLHSKFDKFSISPATGTFPVGTKYYVYAK